MRLTSDPKPVKIRIVSGGEEHSSLDSLRRCFCIPDLQMIEKQLFQWLSRQGVEGLSIAESLKRTLNSFGSANTVDDFLSIYKIFFSNVLEEIGEYSLCQLLELWYEHPHYNKNADFIIELAFDKDENIKLFCYKHGIDRYTTDWKSTLKAMSLPEAKDILSEMHSNEVDFVYMRKWIGAFWNSKREKRKDDHQFSNKENQIRLFVKDCYDIAWLSADNEIRWGIIKTRWIDKGLSKEDILYRQKAFVMLLVMKEGIYDHSIDWDWLENINTELRNSFVPAQYIYNQAVKNKILDNQAFRYLDLQRKIRVFVLNLFEFWE